MYHLWNPTTTRQIASHSSAQASEPLTSARVVSLARCFELFRQPEQLDAQNEWFCSVCRAHQQATKQLELYRLPPVFVVHLKRFRYTAGLFGGGFKIDTPVSYPLNSVNFSDFLLCPTTHTYSLTGVVFHSGLLGAGHYTAAVRAQGRWWYANDSSFLPMEERDVMRAEAYVLFFTRDDEKAGAGAGAGAAAAAASASSSSASSAPPASSAVKG